MPLYSMPQLNQSYIDHSTGWSEQDQNTYHRMPYWMAKMQNEVIQEDPLFDLLVGTMKWQANSGDVGRVISKTRPPQTRQSFNPNRLSEMPKVDSYMPGERQVPFYVYMHMHTTKPMRFYPAFADFFDHTEDAVQTISHQQKRDQELFIRTYMFHQSPAVFLPNRSGSGIIDNEIVLTGGSLQGNGDDDWSTAKSLAWLATILPTIGQPGNLSIQSVDLACTYMSAQGMKPYRGSNKQIGEDMGIDSTYLLVCGDEAFGTFRYDPWLRVNKHITLDVVYNKKFKGNFMGRWTTKIEKYPLRFDLATDGSVTVPAPEIVVTDENAENAGEPIPNPAYLNAGYEVAWLFSGEEHYKKVTVGPPPAMFRSSSVPKGFGRLTWNGEIEITPHFLIDAIDSAGNKVQMLNTDGMWVQARARTTYGIAGTQKRGVLPIIFKRVLGARNPLPSV